MKQFPIRIRGFPAEIPYSAEGSAADAEHDFGTVCMTSPGLADGHPLGRICHPHIRIGRK